MTSAQEMLKMTFMKAGCVDILQTKACQRILARCGGVPRLLHNLCHALPNALKQQVALTEEGTLRVLDEVAFRNAIQTYDVR